MVFSFIRNIIVGFFSFVDKFVVLRNKQIAFMSTPDFSDNSFAMFFQMNEKLKGYHFVWLIDSNSMVDRFNSLSENKITFCKRKSLKGLFYFLTSSYIFQTHGGYSFVNKKNGRVVVNLWHGMPIKNIGYLDKRIKCYPFYFDYTISTSPFYTKVLSEVFNIEKNQILELGLPRNDSLVKKDKNDFLEIKIKFDTSTNKKIVFWLPTCRDGEVFSNDQFSLLSGSREDVLKKLYGFDKAISSLGVTVVIKLHFFDYLNHEFSEQLILENIRLIPSSAWESYNLQLYNALSISDGLITDLSSVLIDYSITRKPIAVTSVPEQNMKRGMIFESDEIRSACYNINDIEDMIVFLKSVSEDVELNNYKILSKFNSQAGKMQSNSTTRLMQEFGFI